MYSGNARDNRDISAVDEPEEINWMFPQRSRRTMYGDRSSAVSLLLDNLTNRALSMTFQTPLKNFAAKIFLLKVVGGGATFLLTLYMLYRVYVTPIPSVRPSVCHTRDLYQNG